MFIIMGKFRFPPIFEETTFHQNLKVYKIKNKNWFHDEDNRKNTFQHCIDTILLNS